jgi:tetratricopeptide (TPR) repeat protein
MPVSKKPRHKRKPQAAVKPVTLPDRRAIERLMAAFTAQAGLTEPAGDDPISQAKEIMYDAWEESDPIARIALARRALEVSPLCADAYVLLAEEAATSTEEARDLFAKGVQAGEGALGPQAFEEYAGHFWGYHATRPYMRARAGLAGTLLKLGDIAGAIGHFRDMLRLNPGDNQGIRYTLLGCLLRQDDAEAVRELLDAYEDEGSAFWLYTRVLMAFRSGARTEAELAALVRDAMEANEYVPAILAGAMRPVISKSGYMSMGGADEATEYIGECGSVWRGTPGAVEWLAQAASAASPKRRVLRARR